MPGFDSFVVALLHMNGADESTTFTDETGKSWTAKNQAQIDTAQFKFGSASGLFDGTGDYLQGVDSADWAFGTGDFTIDFWIRFNALPGSGNQMHFWTQNIDDINNYIWFWLENTAGTYSYKFKARLAASTVIDLSVNSSGLAVNTWYHIELDRNGNNWYFFQDGVQQGSTGSSAGSVPDLAVVPYIGTRGGGEGVNGWIDEYRISKGIARNIANFTPPVNEYNKPGGYVMIL